MDKIAAYSLILAEHPLWQEKVAAPRQIKILREMVDAGDLPGARRFIQQLQDAGVLKISPQGTQIKHLGSGAEGVGTLVAGAADSPEPLAVRKAYDRGSAVFDRKNLAEKHNIMRRAKNNPNFAKTYSSKIRKGKGGTPYTIGEFVEGSEDIFGRGGDLINRVGGKGSTEFSRAVNFLPGAEFGVGAKKTLGDVIGNPGNIIITPDGTPKIIDVIPGTVQGAAQYVSGSSAPIRRQQKLLGLPQGKTAPNVAEAMKHNHALIAKFQENPDLMRKGQALASRKLPTAFESLYDIPGVAPSDVGADGLRRASRKRALSGL